METKKYRIYLDVCCLNRPFDDLSNDRVRLEADAVLSVLSHCNAGEWTLVNSDVLKAEMSKQTDKRRLEKATELLAVATEELKTTSQAVSKAEEFQRIGIGVFDSYHLAVADENKCDVFLTTDDRFLKKAKSQELFVKAANPAIWIMEVL